jgi:hypothetical protein
VSEAWEDGRTRDLGVPPEFEEQWLAELTTRKLASPNKPDNSMGIHFFSRNRDIAHLKLFIR